MSISDAEYETLVQEILKRVIAKLQETEYLKTNNATPQPSNACCKKESVPVVSKTFKKRIITERDVTAAAAEGAQCINVCENAILTDLAREYAAKHCIEVVRG